MTRIAPVIQLGDRRRGESGQMLIIMVFALIVMLVFAGLVIDGGYAWTQQRNTQNAADSIAQSGTVVIAERLVGGVRTGADIITAMDRAAAANSPGGSTYTAYYTAGNTGDANIGCLIDSSGNCTSSLASAVRVTTGAIPTQARGVRVITAYSFDTTFSRAMAALPGVTAIGRLTASGEATAITGPVRGVCAAQDGCGVWPLTVPVAMIWCEAKAGMHMVPGDSNWPIVDPTIADATNMATVPLCTGQSANIGYLDLGTGNLQQQIANPSNTAFSLPTWLQAQTGAVNATQDELRAYNGQVVLVPMYDGTCRVQPAGTDLSDCPPGEEGVGNNTFYHIPQFAAFLVYNSYTQGVDKTACEQAPGYPRGDLGGKTGCIKGWFVRYITQGPVGVDTGGYENSPASMGIQLVK